MDKNIFLKFKCALFDLDGVVFDTEPQYTVFWRGEFQHYYPEEPGMEMRIKGMALTEIYERFLKDYETEWPLITQRLNDFEANMQFVYVDGFEEFVNLLRNKGIKTAVVTSSNRDKMVNVYKKCPEFKDYFDRVFTAEDFAKSKPDPDCYLRGMDYFGCQASETMVFEDSINGLKSAKASGGFVVGLTTSNPESVVGEYADVMISDYR